MKWLWWCGRWETHFDPLRPTSIRQQSRRPRRFTCDIFPSMNPSPHRQTHLVWYLFALCQRPIEVKEPANLFRLATSVLLMCLVSPLVVCMSTPPEIIYHRRWLSVCFLYRFIFCRVVWIGKVIERSELRCLVSCIY